LVNQKLVNQYHRHMISGINIQKNSACLYASCLSKCLHVYALILLVFGLHNAEAKSKIYGISYVIVTNNQPYKRINEILNIQSDSFYAPNKNLYPVVRQRNKNVVQQFCDNDNDGKWNFLLIEISLEANSIDTLEVKWLQKSELTSFNNKTNVRFSLKSKTSEPSPEIKSITRSRGFMQDIANPVYQLEGPGIENDKVAFRAFFDYRNGKDIYGKITPKPILDNVGLLGSWHEMQPWGMDILRVGKSLGAGALAVKENNKIYQLGDADSSQFTALYDGPLQASFQLKFIHWDAGSSKKNGSETISVSQGDFFYKNNIILSLNSGQALVSGMANFILDSATYTQHNSTLSSISTYGKQAEGSDSNLGLAIMFPTSDYSSHATTLSTDSIPNTSYVALKPSSSKKTIYFFACWEKTDARFETENGFKNYLQQTATRLANPILVKLIHHKN